MRRGRALGPGRLWKRDHVWLLDYTDAKGQRRREGLSTDKRTAERIRSELIHRRDLERAGLGQEAGQGILLSELVEQYLVDLQPRVSARHYTNVKSGLRAILVELEGMTVGELRQVDAVRIRSAAVAEGLSNRTANLRIDRLKATLTWARESGLIAANPLEHVRRLPETAEHRRVHRRAMSEDEIARFLAACAADDAACDELLHDRRGSTPRIPQAPLFQILLETGARWGEARQATWGDLDLQRGVLVLRAENTKSRRQRVVPLREELTSTLRDLRALHAEVLGRVPTVLEQVFLTPEGAGWPWHTANVMRILDRVLERAGIPRVDVEGRKLDIHALRHTAATRLARAGAPLMHTQRILGHSDPKLTAAVYSHLDAEDLRGAVELLPSIGPAAEAKEAR